MIKKIFICLALCAVLCGIVGCGNNEQISSSTDETSTYSSPQSTTDESTQSQSDTQPDPEDDVTTNAFVLTVNGKELSGNYGLQFNYEYRYAELPIVAILTELGANIQWQSETTASIKINGRSYRLNIENASLYEDVYVGNSINIFRMAPGDHHGVFYRTLDKELIIDSDSAKLLLIVDLGMAMVIDIDNKTVNIVKRSEN